MAVENPRILVLGEQVGPYLELTVRDNGRGMDDYTLRHAAEALFSTKGEVGVAYCFIPANTSVHLFVCTLIMNSLPVACT